MENDSWRHGEAVGDDTRNEGLSALRCTPWAVRFGLADEVHFESGRRSVTDEPAMLSDGPVLVTVIKVVEVVAAVTGSAESALLM